MVSSGAKVSSLVNDSTLRTADSVCEGSSSNLQAIVSSVACALVLSIVSAFPQARAPSALPASYEVSAFSITAFSEKLSAMICSSITSFTTPQSASSGVNILARLSPARKVVIAASIRWPTARLSRSRAQTNRTRAPSAARRAASCTSASVRPVCGAPTRHFTCALLLGMSIMSVAPFEGRGKAARKRPVMGRGTPEPP